MAAQPETVPAPSVASESKSSKTPPTEKTAAKLLNEVAGVLAKVKGAAAAGIAAGARPRARCRRSCAGRLNAFLPGGVAFYVAAVLACLVLSGNSSILKELSVTLGLANSVVASAADAAVVAKASALDVSTAVANMGVEILASSTYLAKIAREGIDLANMSIQRRHGRAILTDGFAAYDWIRNYSDATIPPSVNI